MKGFLGTVTGKINTNEFSFTAEAKVKKFQYIKLYHDDVGFVLAQIIELINEEDEIECECEIIGYRDSRGLLRVPNTTISHESEVYNADSEFIKKVLGLDQKRDNAHQLYVGLLEDYDMISVKLDVNKLVTKHLAVLAKTGAGKSYTLGVMVEELLEQGVPCVVIDPHGEYTSLKKPNTNEEEVELMHRYGVKPKSYSDKIIEYSPDTSINKDAKPYSITINSLSAQEISNLTPMSVSGTQLGLLYNAINDVKEDEEEYDLIDVRERIEAVNSTSKYGLYACLDFLENIDVFSHNPVDASELVNPGKATLLNLRGVPPEVQKIIVAKVCTDLFEKRKRDEIPPLFLIVEEAHNFCPERNFGESPSSYILRNIASEGRKFGLGLSIVSQRPARVDKNVLSQCNTQVIQKVTNPNDLKAIKNSAENISKSVVNNIPTLPVGTALIVGASAKPILVDVRVRRTEHGGKSVSFDYDEEDYEKKEEEEVEMVKVKVVNLMNKSELTPYYLARVKQGESAVKLLVDEDGNVRDEELRIVEVREEVSVQGKEKNLYEFIKRRRKTSVSALFNALNYSFQDINYLLKELRKKGLIVINGSSIRLVNEQGFDLSEYAVSENVRVKRVKEEEVPGYNSSKKRIIEGLESNGLSVERVNRVFLQ